MQSHNRFINNEYYQGLANYLNSDDEQQNDYFNKDYIDENVTKENKILAQIST